MPEQDSFQDLMSLLQAGEDDAAADLFERFASQLVAKARNRLSPAVRRKIDPEDVVQSVYRSFFKRFDDGQFKLENWDSLWGLLLTITIRKCGRNTQHFHTAGRDVHREVPAANADKSGRPKWEAIAREPTPSEAVMLSETVEHLLGSLGERDQQIVSLALQGYSTTEISEEIGRAERTVRRKLQETRERLTTMRDENRAT